MMTLLIAGCGIAWVGTEPRLTPITICRARPGERSASHNTSALVTAVAMTYSDGSPLALAGASDLLDDPRVKRPGLFGGACKTQDNRQQIPSKMGVDWEPSRRDA